MPEDAFQADDEEDDDTDICWIWPENAAVCNVFFCLGTQWRREFPAMADREIWIGLMYTEAEAAMRMLHVPRREWPEIFDGLRVMETAALRVLNKAR